MQEKQTPTIKEIAIDDATAKGVYSNLAVISHLREEFILDFAQTLPGTPGPVVRSRIIMTPECTARLHAALGENIEKYRTGAMRTGNTYDA